MQGVHIYPKFIPGDLCQTLIDKYKPLATKVNDPSYSVYHRYDFIDKFGEFSPSPPPGYIQSIRWFFTSYEVGGFIDVHTDGHSTVRGQPSKYSILYYLNDDYVGGELVMPSVGLVIKPTKGTVVIMDQDIEHYVRELTVGEKHLLRVDAIRRE